MKIADADATKSHKKNGTKRDRTERE